MRPENGSLGNLVRSLRQQKGWTLREMSQMVDIPLSTLAKVENDKLSLNYEKLQQFASRLGMSISELLGQADEKRVPGGALVTARKSVTREDNSVRIETSNYDYRYLCADLSQRRMVPILVRIRAHTLEEFDQLPRHPGEEFVYVIEGKVEVHTEFYSPVLLETGQGIYLDSSMSHAYIARDCTEALVLAVCSGEDTNLADQLMTLADGDVAQRG
ncbi:XRE family transcriptional regulator [Novosphingobium sp. P6W]|nr:XRE family transcriptional regulator [Novosphingobium sp. P6W]